MLPLSPSNLKIQQKPAGVLAQWIEQHFPNLRNRVDSREKFFNFFNSETLYWNDAMGGVACSRPDYPLSDPCYLIGQRIGLIHVTQ